MSLLNCVELVLEVGGGPMGRPMELAKSLVLWVALAELVESCPVDEADDEACDAIKLSSLRAS